MKKRLLNQTLNLDKTDFILTPNQSKRNCLEETVNLLLVKDENQ